MLDIVGDGLNSDGILGLRGDSGGAIYKWDESQLTARLRSTTSSGLEQETFIDMVVDGAVNVYYNGLLNFYGEQQGLSVRRTTGSSTLLDLEDTSGTLEARLATQASGQFRITAELANRGIDLYGTDSVGADSLSFRSNPDGAVELYFDNAQKFATTADGADIINSAVSDTILDVVGSGTNIDGVLGVRGDSGGARLYWDESAASAILGQTAADGTLEESWIDMVDNGAVTVFHNGTAMARTALAASGGLEVNNTVTGAGFERALTVSDLVVAPVMVLLAANKTMTSTETLTDVTGFTATTLASTRYKFRIVLFVQSGTAGTNPGLRLLLNHTTAQSSKEGRILEFRDSGLVQSVRALPDASTITGLNAGTTSDENMLVYEGFFETITAGTLQLEAAQNTSNGTGTIITEGSSFEVWATQ